MAVELTVIVVNHQSEATLGECLAALERHGRGLELEVVLVNNLPSPRAEAMAGACSLPVRCHGNRRPQGFAANCNLGSTLGQGDWFLFLNPDCILGGDLAGFLAVARRLDRAGVVCCRLVDPGGQRPQNVRRFPSLGAVLYRGLGLGRWLPQPASYRRYMMADHHDWQRAQTIDWCFGAFMAISRPRFQEEGGFDEGFFLYYEDMDLCLRLARAGWRNYYLPSPTAVHQHQRQSARHAVSRLKMIHLASILRYFTKHRYWARVPLAAR